MPADGAGRRWRRPVPAHWHAPELAHHRRDRRGAAGIREQAVEISALLLDARGRRGGGKGAGHAGGIGNGSRDRSCSRVAAELETMRNGADGMRQRHCRRGIGCRRCGGDSIPRWRMALGGMAACATVARARTRARGDVVARGEDVAHLREAARPRRSRGRRRSRNWPARRSENSSRPWHSDCRRRAQISRAAPPTPRKCAI